MKFFALFLVVAVAFEAVLGQCLRPCAPNVVTIAGPGCLPDAEIFYSPAVATSPAIIQSNCLAANLADTLSLLTVSSLLAEKLPLGCPSGCGCGCGCRCGYGCGCGCGCGCGYGPYGYAL
ncbi:unnamed protein product [Parnassius mnemosyne]|uniref:Uncharacterized protein n=1 Tax=Parnassius mnemosyne TaxID=213953 RepID=A0AAV1LFU6_9NEOP